MDILTALHTINNTLNKISVSGADNLGYLLASMQLMDKVIEVLEKPKEETPASEKE